MRSLRILCQVSLVKQLTNGGAGTEAKNGLILKAIAFNSATAKKSNNSI